MNEKIPEVDCTPHVVEHIKKVQWNMGVIRRAISKAGLRHDSSKLKLPEKPGYDRIAAMPKTVKYKSPEYKKILDSARSQIDHHKKHNRHHPEFFENGVSGMTLVDLIELFGDFCAATELNADGDIHKSIEFGAKEYEWGDVLTSILHNTASELKIGKNHKVY